MRRASTVLAGAAVPALLLAGCSAPWSHSPTDKFLDAVNDGDWSAAAGQTTDPDAAGRWLADLGDSTGDTSLHLSADDGSTTATWTVPAGDEVTTDGTLTTGDGGKVTWTPAVFSDQLGDSDTVTYADDRTWNVPVTDIRNASQMSWTPVTVVTATKEADLQAVADAVRPAIPDFDTQDAASQVRDAGDGAATLFSLRPEDAGKVADALADIPGVSTREEGRLLSGRETRSPLDGDLRDYWNQQLDKSAGWTLATSAGNVLGQKAPGKTDPVHTTMDLGVQGAAQRALDAEQRPAAIVAISPSTGGIVAAAQNGAADDQGTPAMTGLFPPGSTFKTVTTSAALGKGTVHPDDTVACPATTEVDGRVIPNDHDFDLGDVPMHTAFAQSCNTTQAMISRDLDPAHLKNTAARLGLGVDFTAPGMTSVTGSVPETGQGAARVESAIGQGQVVASPFGLALMEASVANGGRMVTPSVIQGQKTTSDQQPEPLDPTVVEELRSMMRETVTSGTARSLSDIPGLGGKTGTAEVDGGAAHGWFVGTVGDLAFCTFIAGADSSEPAVDLSGRFLRDGALSQYTAGVAE
jgi:hypothetical protein